MNPVVLGEDAPFVYKDAIFFSGHKFIGGPGHVNFSFVSNHTPLFFSPSLPPPFPPPIVKSSRV